MGPGGRTLVICGAVAFGLSTAFPIIASLLPEGSAPSWVGIVDVVLALAVVSLGLGKSKQSYLYEVDGGKPFALAGLWENWWGTGDKESPRSLGPMRTGYRRRLSPGCRWSSTQ